MLVKLQDGDARAAVLLERIIVDFSPQNVTELQSLRWHFEIRSPLPFSWLC